MVAVVVIIIIIAAIASGDEESSPTASSRPTPTPEPIRVTAPDLYDEFKANAVRAKAKYKDRLAIVTGVVADFEITENFFFQDDEILVLATGSRGIGGIDCDYDDDTQSTKAQQLDIGDAVLVAGKVTYDYSVVINPCAILLSSPATE